MLREAEKVKVDGQEEEGGGPAIAGSPAPGPVLLRYLEVVS